MLLLALYALVSALTSVISATVGMAGGTVLLSFLSLFYGYRELIPLHAAVQLTSNATRSWLLRTHLEKVVFRNFVLGSVVGVALGTYFVGKLSDETGPSLLIAIYVLYELLKPKRFPKFQVSDRGFVLVGAVVGTLSMFIGATGLLLGAFILGREGTKEQTIANQAAMQTFNHAAKLVGFIYLGWSMQGQWAAFAVLSAGAILGTRFGVRILRRIDPRFFFWLFRGVLLISALKIIASAIPHLINR